MAKVYEGDSPYVFVSYAHADSKKVLPLIDALVAGGCRVSYDEGIEWASSWPENIANHLHDCSRFLVFMSRAAALSENCGDEIYYALNNRKEMLVAYIDDVDLDKINRGFDMRLTKRQAKHRGDYDSDEAFVAALLREKVLETCLSDNDDGVVPPPPPPPFPPIGLVVAVVTVILVALVLVFGSQPSKGGSDQPGSGEAVVEGGADDVSGTEASSGSETVEASAEGLSGYTWSELKNISNEIAVAKSDNEGIEIARSYGLVGSDGKLQGDTKPITLADGTEACVRIAGFRHDDLADGGGKAGITFEFADIPAKNRMNPTSTNEGGWEKCEMREWLNSDFLLLLPDDLASGIVAVKKHTNNVGKLESETNTSVVTTTSDRLWLLSASEIYGKIPAFEPYVQQSPSTYNAEGTQYKLYSDQGVSTSSYDFCVKKSGDANVWWRLRTPHTYESEYYLYVFGAGDCGWAQDAASYGGISPCFCY